MKKSKATKEAKNTDGSMSLSGHLKELRNRIAVVVVLLLVTFTVCVSFAPAFITYLTDMGTAYNYVFVYIAPQELLLVYLNAALIGALVLCFPVVAYEVYAVPVSAGVSVVFSLGHCLPAQCFLYLASPLPGISACLLFSAS